MLFKSLLSPIKSITSSLVDSNSSTSHVGSSILAPLSLSTITNLVSPSTVTNTVSSITNSVATNPVSTITGILGGVTGSSSPLSTVTNLVGSLTGSANGAPLDAVTHIIGGVTGGANGGPLGTVTGIIGGITGGADGGPLGAVTGILGGITGGANGGALGTVTGIIGGITGGDLAHNPVTGVIQSGIGVLQGLESLKTDIINTGINTVAGTIISAVHQSEHPIGDLAHLGTLTFDTSRDTVNGTLEAVSHLAGADVGGAVGSLTGVVGTLVNNGSTAANTIQHIVGDITNIGNTGPLGTITGIIGGITGGIGGGGTGGPLGVITNIIGGITGGDLSHNPVTGAIQTGIDVLQGVESLKTDIINTGINTVGGVLSGVLPGVHPITDLTHLGTLTFDTSRDTVNGTLEAVSHLAGADVGGAVGSLTGVVGTLIHNGSTASGLVQHAVGDLTNVGGLIGGIGGGTGGPLGSIGDIIGGITGGIGGGTSGPLGVITNIIGGITGGDLSHNPVTGAIQTGIDVLQGVESLKTDIINTGINTVGGVLSGVLPGVHPITDLTHLGTLTFETSRDTVNGTLEAVSHLAGADVGGAVGSLTGVVGTLIHNGSTASGLVQHAVGDLTNVGDLIGGITDGIGGGTGGPLGSIGDIIGGITGGIGGGTGGPLGSIGDIIGGITGGITGGGNNPLGSLTDILGTISHGVNSADVISGIAQPIQTVISNGNIAIDALQSHVSNLFSDGSLDSLNNLINISVGHGDYNAHGSIDGILDALTGTVASSIAVGEPHPNGGSLTDLVSLQSPLNSLTDHLLSSVNHF
ncbi:beta strand repeat-containing protein [Acinetobacter colistiniresistens]|uniref:beta strand repeat-containing protein n=1 Tax=Acinetobacter colistiniresistens TaxID=280145 RepID=UPI000DD03318